MNDKVVQLIQVDTSSNMWIGCSHIWDNVHYFYLFSFKNCVYLGQVHSLLSARTAERSSQLG